jgi:hypothetical protein
VSPIPKECIFCQADFRNAERTREHIIPQWLISELRIGDGQLTSTHFDGKLAIKSRSMAPRSFLAGRVCGPCNHGWMSRLEIAFAPLFRALNSGKRTFAQLSRSERTIVARWTLKSLAALNWASGYIHSIPPEHRHILARHANELPPNVFVFGTRWTRSWGVAAAQEDFLIASPSQWQLKDDEREVRLPKGGYYKIGIQVGSLLLGAFYWPYTLWHVEVSANAHQLVWPPRRFARSRLDRRNDQRSLMDALNRGYGPMVLASYLRAIRVRDHTLIGVLADYWSQLDQSAATQQSWADASSSSYRLHESMREAKRSQEERQPTIAVEEQPRDFHVVSYTPANPSSRILTSPGHG